MHPSNVSIRSLPGQQGRRLNRVLVSAALPLGVHVLGAEPCVVLGRGKTSHVLIPSDAVSRRHAVIQHGPNGYSINDLGSSNGTYVNGEQVTAPRRLRTEDVIALGSLTLRFLELEGTRDELLLRFDPRAANTRASVRPQPTAPSKGITARRFPAPSDPSHSTVILEDGFLDEAPQSTR